MLGFSPLAAAPLASAGLGTLLASLAATEAKDTASVSAAITASASFAVTEAKDVASFAAVRGDIVGYLASTEARDTASFGVIASNRMVLAATEAADSLAINASVISYTILQTTEATDVASFTANNQNIYFNLAEAPDIAAFNIAMTGTMSMAATETPDSYNQNAYILWLTPTQPDDPSIWVPKNDPTPYLTTVI